MNLNISKTVLSRLFVIFFFVFIINVLFVNQRNFYRKKLLKIKMIDQDEEPEVEERLMCQALPVTELKKGVDLNVPPTTGEDYLSRVRFVSRLIR